LLSKALLLSNTALPIYVIKSLAFIKHSIAAHQTHSTSQQQLRYPVSLLVKIVKKYTHRRSMLTTT